MKDLPRVYANPINKKINNVQEQYMGSDKITKSKNDVNKIISSLFNNESFTFRRLFEITLKDRVITTNIISKIGVKLLTIDNELILIDDILDIKEISSQE